MGISSLTGAFGLGRQSAKDVAASSFLFLPATSVGLAPQQNAAALPAEVGGAYFPRGSYKASVAGGGDTALTVRGDGIGSLLLAYSGVDTSTPVSGQTGAYSHALSPFAPAAGVDLPWYTLLKSISSLTTEQHLNSKMRSLRLDIPKSSIISAQASWFSTTPSNVAVPSSPVFDSSAFFVTTVGSVALSQEGGSGNISANSVKQERISLTMTNQLSEDEYSVGNLFPDDVTLLQKSLTVDMDVVIRDTTLYAATYTNGLSLPASMSPTLYRGTLLLTLTSTAVIGATTQPYSLACYFPGLDFLMMPISLQGSDIVRATLSTRVTLGPSGSDTFLFTLINGIASY